MKATFDLFPALETRLREQARPQERESLPRLRDSSLEASRDRLEALEQRPGWDRVLLCLDEFERFEEVVGEKPKTKPQLVQLMGLLRRPFNTVAECGCWSRGTRRSRNSDH